MFVGELEFSDIPIDTESKLGDFNRQPGVGRVTILLICYLFSLAFLHVPLGLRVLHRGDSDEPSERSRGL